MEIGAGLQGLTEGLPTRWRPLYDDYGPALGSGARIPRRGCATWAGDDKLPHNRNRPE
jgi:hypothetical protein